MKRKTLKTPRRRYVSLKGVVIVTSILFAISSVFLTIESVTTSAEVASLQTKQAVHSSQRRDLQEDLVKITSTSGLEEEAKLLGFIKPSDLIYLGETTNVASKN